MPTKTGRIKLSIYSMALCGLFAALIAAGAFVRIPFPPVPLTLQTLFVILAALVLGPKYSAISVGVYLFIGLAGFPVFVKGGGLGYVFQPTFGYLFGFFLAAIIVGYLSGMKSGVKHRTLYYWAIGLIGIIIIYLTGMIYMYIILRFYMKSPIGFVSMITFNFLFTVTGDIFKCLAAAILTSRLLPILEKSPRFHELK